MSPARPSAHRLLLAAAVVTMATLAQHPAGSAAEPAVPAAAPAVVRTEKTKVTAIVEDLPQAGAIAVKPTGQAFLVIDHGSSAIEMVDCEDPARRHRAVSPFGEGERPVAIGCVDSLRVAVVTRTGRDWAVKIFSLAAPGTAVDPADTVQSIPLGESDDDADATVSMAVSPSRKWVVITGLPQPLPAVMRGAIAGARIGGMSTRNCPRPEPRKTSEGGAGFLATAVTISPADQLVLFERPDPTPSTDRLAMYSTVGTVQLLSLDCGLPRVRAAAYAQESLWVLAGNPADERVPEGLWRLDAAMQDRRQVVRPVCVARFAAPIAVAPLSNGRLLVVHGDPRRTVSLVEPAP